MLKSRLELKKLASQAWFTILVGALLALFVFGVLSVAASFILLSTENPSEQIATASLIVLILSAAVSGFLDSCILGSGVSVHSIISHAAVSVIFIIIGALSGGITSACLMNAVTYLGVGAGFAFLGRPKAKRKFRNLKFISG